jgi:PAS domain S-box-containing protein
VKAKQKCWEVFDCTETECPVYVSRELKCWLVPGTHCRNEIQGKFLEKIEMCLECEPFKANLDLDSMGDTLKVVSEQFAEFSRIVRERDRELEGISMEMALGLSEAFVALKKISSGDPLVRIPEASELELISKLKHMVNQTAENLAEIVDLSHEFAMGLAEHFDVLHRVSKGELSARVTGSSEVELLESLKNVTNKMIESVSREIAERERAEKGLREAHDQLERRVKERMAELVEANKQLRREKEEHEQAEKEARASEEKYRLLFHYDPNPLFHIETGQGRILDANAQALEKYQYTMEELSGKQLPRLFHKEDGDQLWKRIQSASGEYFLMPRARAEKKSGNSFIVEIHASAGKFQDAEEPSLIVRTVDITRRLEREAQLVQAGKMATLGEMATGIAHELNQPLSVIRAGTDFFSKTVARGEKVSDEHLLKVSRNIGQQVDRASGIIDHLREFGRRTDFGLQPVNINEPIRNIFTLLGQQLKLREIEVEVRLEEGLPSVFADKYRLEQIFLNLVTNARDAMEGKVEGGKKLTILTRRDGDKVVASVSDTGRGIPQHLKEKIFEPFFTTKEVGKGTGLGLSITYSLAKGFGGEIRVESEPGVGSTFRAVFPIYSQGERGNGKNPSH